MRLLSIKFKAVPKFISAKILKLEKKRLIIHEIVILYDCEIFLFIIQYIVKKRDFYLLVFKNVYSCNIMMKFLTKSFYILR